MLLLTNFSALTPPVIIFPYSFGLTRLASTPFHILYDQKHTRGVDFGGSHHQKFIRHRERPSIITANTTGGRLRKYFFLLCLVLGRGAGKLLQILGGRRGVSSGSNSYSYKASLLRLIAHFCYTGRIGATPVWELCMGVKTRGLFR